MANTILFKRLFEVRFLHEYYLADAAGALFFEKSFTDRQLFLEKQIIAGRYNILNDIDIEPTPETRQRMKGYRMKFGTTATGFIVGAPGNNSVVGATTLFEPETQIPRGLRLSFFIRAKNPLFRSFTATRIRRPQDLSTSFWFSNSRKVESLDFFPSLSEEPPLIAAGKTYEPGEIVRIGSDLLEAVTQTDTANPINWAVINGSGYATESDRILVPKRVNWAWTGAVGTVAFTLKKEDDTIVKTIKVNVATSPRLIPLNFFRKSETSAEIIPDGFYKLEIVSTDAIGSRPLFLHGEMTGSSSPSPSPGRLFTPTGLLGIVEIVHDSMPFALPYLDEAGRRRQVPLPDGSISHPVFEVRWLSRGAWWRYRSDRDRDLTAQNDAIMILDKIGKDLVTKQSKRFFAFSQVFHQSGTPDIRLPNPMPDALRPGVDGRLYADVLISNVPNLIEAT